MKNNRKEQDRKFVLPKVITKTKSKTKKPNFFCEDFSILLYIKNEWMKMISGFYLFYHGSTRHYGLQPIYIYVYTWEYLMQKKVGENEKEIIVDS